MDPKRIVYLSIQVILLLAVLGASGYALDRLWKKSEGYAPYMSETNNPSFRARYLGETRQGSRKAANYISEAAAVEGYGDLLIHAASPSSYISEYYDGSGATGANVAAGAPGVFAEVMLETNPPKYPPVFYPNVPKSMLVGEFNPIDPYWPDLPISSDLMIFDPRQECQCKGNAAGNAIIWGNANFNPVAMGGNCDGGGGKKVPC